jgi:hypothetical protein
MRSITMSIATATLLLTGGLLGVPQVTWALADEPLSQNPAIVTDSEKKTPGSGDVQERAIRQGAAAGESPVCVCTSTAGQCVFSAVHGCVPSQGPVGCNSGCFEQKPQLGKVRPSVVPKADAPVLQHRGVESEQPTSSEKEGK